MKKQDVIENMPTDEILLAEAKEAYIELEMSPKDMRLSIMSVRQHAKENNWDDEDKSMVYPTLTPSSMAWANRLLSGGS